MYKNIEKNLHEWKNIKNKKPFLLSGARQTGKTYIIEKFAEAEYKDLIKINLEKTPEVWEVLSIFNIVEVALAIVGLIYVPRKTKFNI